MIKEEGGRRYFSEDNVYDKLIKINDDLYYAQYDTREGDFDEATGFFVLTFQNNNFTGSTSEDYTDIYVSAGTDSYAPGSISIPTNNTPVEIIYKRTLANNMSLYVRPVTAVTVHFQTVDPDVINQFTVYFFTSSGQSQVAFPSTRPWSSESSGQLKMTIARNASHTTPYNYANVRVLYGAYDHWIGMKNVESENTFIDNGIVLSSAIQDMYITVDVFQVFVHTARINYPPSNWPGSTTARLKNNMIKVNGIEITQSPDTTTPGIVLYNFPESAGASSTNGTTAVVIEGKTPARALQYGSQSWALSNDDYVPVTRVETSELSYSDKHFEADVVSFDAVRVSFTYDCDTAGKLKVVQYKPNNWADGWPTSLTNTAGFTRNDLGTLQQTGTTLTTDQVMPVPCFRIMQSDVDDTLPAPTGYHPDVYNRFHLHFHNPYTGSDDDLGEFNFTNTERWFNFVPAMYGSIAQVFQASRNSTYHNFQFTAELHSAWEGGTYEIYEVRAVNYGSSGWSNHSVTEVSSKRLVDGYIPGENPEDQDYMMYVRIHSSLNLSVSTNKAFLKFVDSHGTELTEMYPTEDDLGQPEAVSGEANAWQWKVKTKANVWDKFVSGTSGPKYSSDYEWQMAVRFEDQALGFKNTVYTYFHCQPVLKLWFGTTGVVETDNIQFDNDGNAVIYYFPWVMGETEARVCGSGGHTEDPNATANFPANVGDAFPLNDTPVTISGDTTGLTFTYRGIVETAYGWGYKIDVSGASASFSGTVNLRAEVASEVVTATVTREMTVHEIAWSDGSAMNYTTDLSQVYLSPTQEETAVEVQLALRNPDHYNLISPNTKVELVHPDDKDYNQHIHVQLSTYAFQTTYQLAVVFDTEANLGDVSDQEATRWYYTGMPIEFTVSVQRTDAGGGGVLSTTYNITLGPVITLHNNLPLLGNNSTSQFNIQNDNFTIAQVRGHEWFKNAENDIVCTNNGAIASSITTETGRQFNVTWTYPTGVSLVEGTPTPNGAHHDAGEADYTYDKQWEVRDTDGTTVLMTVQHAATWTDADGTTHYYQNGGAWRITVLDEDSLNDGTLAGKVEVSDGTAAISMMHWYDGKKSKNINLNCVKEMSVAGIHFMTNPTHSSGYYHGAMKFSEAFMPPVIFTADTSAYSLRVYLKFRDSDNMQFSGAQFHVNGTYASEIETHVKQNTDHTNIHTTVGTQEYDKPWDICAEARIKSDIGSLSRINEQLCFSTTTSHPELARYWTGMQLPFTVIVPRTSGEAFTSPTIKIPLGPVLGLYTMNDGRLNSNNQLITNGGSIKPETGEAYLVRARAREWIHNGTTPGEVSGYCGTINGRTYEVKFKYNDVEIENTTGGNIPQNRHNTNFDINCPTHWIDYSGEHEYNSDGSGDWGAWKIDVISDSGLTTSGTMEVSMNVSGGSEMKAWYPAEKMNVSVSQISLVKIVRAQDISVFRGNPRITDPVTIWDNTMSGPVKMPARGSVAIIFANIPEFIDE